MKPTKGCSLNHFNWTDAFLHSKPYNTLIYKHKSCFRFLHILFIVGERDGHLLTHFVYGCVNFPLLTLPCVNLLESLSTFLLAYRFQALYAYNMRKPTTMHFVMAFSLNMFFKIVSLHFSFVAWRKELKCSHVCSIFVFTIKESSWLYR